MFTTWMFTAGMVATGSALAGRTLGSVTTGSVGTGATFARTLLGPRSGTTFGAVSAALWALIAVATRTAALGGVGDGHVGNGLF
jgi:hypothetical protein